MSREQQQRRIRVFRRGIVGGSVVGALGVAGLLGINHSAAATSSNTNTGTGTTTTTSTDDDSWGDSSGTSLSSGSSSASHATTRGS